jgi:hypothetical protein
MCRLKRFKLSSFITAPPTTYSDGASEHLVGKAIKMLGMPREDIVILTKVHHIDLSFVPFRGADVLSHRDGEDSMFAKGSSLESDHGRE